MKTAIYTILGFAGCWILGWVVSIFVRYSNDNPMVLWIFIYPLLGYGIYSALEAIAKEGSRLTGKRQSLGKPGSPLR